MGTKADILQKWYDEVWTNGNLDAIDTMFRPDSVASGIIPDFGVQPEEFRNLVGAVLSICEPPKVKVQKALEVDDWVAGLIEVETTDLSERRRVHMTGSVFARFEGEFMIETYNHMDFFSFFEQLGLMPDSSMALLLAGQKLT